MLFDKIGLAGDRVDIDPEVTVTDFKSYEYSSKDFRRTYDGYDVMRIQINIPFKILNGMLYIKDQEYNLGNKTLKDVHDILNQYGTASFFVDYEGFAKLPAVLLGDCSNVVVDVLDGHISPLTLEHFTPNPTITSNVVITSNILIYDEDLKKSKAFTKKGSRLFYDPNKTTKIFVTNLAKDLHLRIDFGPRRLISEKDVSYLLNFKKEIK